MAFVCVFWALLGFWCIGYNRLQNLESGCGMIYAACPAFLGLGVDRSCCNFPASSVPVGSYHTPFLGYPTLWLWDPYPKIR